MNKRVFISVLAFFFWIITLNAADLRLPAIIGSHMVLQQQSEVAIWGWAKAGGKITVKPEWAMVAEHTIADTDGVWKLQIHTPKAGGKYLITISSDTTIVLEDILIGEVWVCSGQSNMEMPVKGFLSQPINGSNSAILHSSNSDIRLFKVEKGMSTSPLNDVKGKWVVASPKEVAWFSATGYFFGRYLQEVIQTPVGLIQSCWGGTKAEAWTDKPTLANGFPEFNLDLQPDKINRNSPTVLFNAMINPILNYGIKGVIWYQGEGNKNNPEQYTRLFPSMIKNWRNSWNKGDFPFYFVQIAPYKYDTIVNSAFLREAQLKTMLGTPNTGMAVTMDIGDYSTIHPPEKALVGERLAYWALAKTYKILGIEYCGPVYKSMEINEEKAILSFDFAALGLTSFDKALEGFEVAGSDKVFHKANATINRNNVIVWSESVDTPVAIRYCWENFITGTLFNTAGLPASSFRTDEW